MVIDLLQVREQVPDARVVLLHQHQLELGVDVLDERGHLLVLHEQVVSAGDVLHDVPLNLGKFSKLLYVTSSLDNPWYCVTMFRYLLVLQDGQATVYQNRGWGRLHKQTNRISKYRVICRTTGS